MTEFIGMLVVGAVVVLLLWRRQESLSYPLALPQGIRIAGLGRRAAAMALDMLPAGIVVLWWWYEPITRFGQQVYAARADEERLAALVAPATLAWAWLTFRLLYAGYCLLFELLWSATPGKRLLGCTVLSERVEPPNAVQLAVRNISRLLELEPLLKIWPFFLVVFLTHSRQRVGDLLARTIVVCGEPRPSAPGAGPGESSER
jgi:uncharacterized RDD family membrane protein YckC